MMTTDVMPRRPTSMVRGGRLVYSFVSLRAHVLSTRPITLVGPDGRAHTGVLLGMYPESGDGFGTGCWIAMLGTPEGRREVFVRTGVVS